ncbi:MAG: hypothetical protein RL722_1001, partial [Pseudomonadota bacterium]|jgi:Tfp pilus assembly protein PilF
VARTQLENGSGQQARRTIETLLAEFPQYADAHDLMGRMHIDLGDFAQALATYRLAASITPRSLTRLQKQGALAFYIGDIDEAAEVLHRAVQLDPHNRLFDLQTLALICLVEYERGDAAALHRMHRRIQAVQKLHPESARLRHLVLVADTLAQAQNGDLNGARASLAHLADERQDTDFDVEAASNLLSTLARLHHHGITHDQAVAWAHDLGLRFCASSAATELLCGAARDHPDMQAELRAAHDAIGKVCESAMDLSRKGQPREAVLALIAAATQSRNARELDLADRLLRHHQSSIADAPALRQQIREAQQRYCSKGSRLPITHAGREAGALALNI